MTETADPRDRLIVALDVAGVPEAEALIARIAEDIVGTIGHGLLVLAGVTEADDAADREWLARKTVALRIFDDDAGVMNRSVIEAGGGILAVSQFTLYASTRKGNRPSYTAAARPEIAAPAFEAFVALLAQLLGGLVSQFLRFHGALPFNITGGPQPCWATLIPGGVRDEGLRIRGFAA